MSKRIDYSLRIPQFIGSFKTQKAAAAYLGINPRSLRRYREEIRHPGGEIARRINRRVYNKFRLYNAFGIVKVKFESGDKVSTRTIARGTAGELEKEFKKAEQRVKDWKEKSAYIIGKRVISVKAGVKWLSTLVKK